MLHQFKVLQSVATSLTSPQGVMGDPFVKQPTEHLKLYDLEGCPYCRRVREVLTLLNLDAEIYPCPKEGRRFRPEAIALTGKAQFPLLVDENTGTVLQESQAIIDYLFKTYGKTGRTPSRWQHLPARDARRSLGSLLSGMRGLRAEHSNHDQGRPAELLELWSFEGSPYTRLVRERLCELELPYVLHNVAKERWQDMGPAVLRLKPGPYEPLHGGKRERELARMQGRMQVPYLVDPNTGARLFESAAILDYLNRTYY